MEPPGLEALTGIAFLADVLAICVNVKKFLFNWKDFLQFGQFLSTTSLPDANPALPGVHS
jgi:hypothetical protein